MPRRGIAFTPIRVRILTPAEGGGNRGSIRKNNGKRLRSADRSLLPVCVVKKREI